MAAGCKNPSAANYSPTANPENYTCLYTLKNQGNCHLFSDVVPDPNSNHSFTMSYSLAGKSWTFFHDYTPDMYIHTREYLYNSVSSVLRKHHEGAPGNYYGVVKPFFIDVIFHAEGNLILETVNWMAELLNTSTDVEAVFENLTHISIWNSSQHTGRIVLADVPPTLTKWVRKTAGQWSFNRFRDILIADGPQFIFSIFRDYALDSTKANTLKPFYDKKLLIDKWFCVRFEFDNVSGRNVMIHDTTVQALKSDR